MKYIGTLLLSNQHKINEALGAYQKLAKNINEVAISYQELNLGAFNQEIFFDIINNKATNISQQYFLAIEDQIKKAGITFPALIETQKNASSKPVIEFQSKIEKMEGVYDSVRYTSFSGVSILIEKVPIVADRAVLTEKFKDEIKAEIEIRITTEEQDRYYQKFIKLKEAYDDLINESIKYVPKEVVHNILDFKENNLTLHPGIIPEIK